MTSSSKIKGDRFHGAFAEERQWAALDSGVGGQSAMASSSEAFPGQMGPQIVDLRTILDESGAITVVESAKNEILEFRRIYYLHSLGTAATRGGHAHRELTQLMVAVAGSFEVRLEGSMGTSFFHLADPSRGLLIPPMTWRVLENFSVGAVCLVLASDHFSEADYIRHYAEFKSLAKI